MASRALVLSGGGPVGIAWETGLAAGLLEAGIDLRDADFTIGTSAGSFVGSQLAGGRDPKAMVASIITQSTEGASTRPTAAANVTPATNLMPLMDLMAKAARGGQSPEAVRKEIGAFALAAKTISEEAFVASMGRIRDEWPAKRFACVAVDALDGSVKVWDNDSGASLPRAVSSSCAVPGVYPPVTINGRRYIDGGMRSSSNADMAAGYDRVLVVLVRVAGTGPTAEASKLRLDGEVATLRAGGATVETIEPDEGSAKALGMNLMDFRRRAAAAEAGIAQGQKEAAHLKAFWR